MEYQNIGKFQKIHNKIIQKKITNENDKEMPRERYIPLEETQKIINNLRSIIIVY